MENEDMVCVVAVNERKKNPNLQQTTYKTPPPPKKKMYTGFHNHILKKHSGFQNK